MPDILKVGPSRPMDQLLARQQELIQREQNSAALNSALRLLVPGVREYDLFAGETSRAAFGDSIPALAVRHAQRATIPRDSDFELTAANLRQFMEGIDDDLIVRFVGVESEAEAELVQSQNMQIMEGRRRLESMGWAGSAAKIGSMLLDPAMLATGVATGGVGAATGLTRAARLATMARAGLVTGVPFAAVEGYRASQDPMVETGDVLAALGGGIGFGVGGAATRGLGRGARFARAGGFAAGGAAVSEVPRTIFDDEYSAGDLLASLGAQFIFAGGIHAIPPRDEAAATMRWLREASTRGRARTELHDLASVGVWSSIETIGGVSTVDISSSLTAKGQAYFGARLKPRVQVKAVPQADYAPLKDAGLGDETIELWKTANATSHPEDAARATADLAAQLRAEARVAADPQQPGAAMGAAGAAEFGYGPAGVEPAGKLATDFSLATLTSARSTMAKVVRLKYAPGQSFDVGLTRWDMPGMVGQSPIASIRRVNNAVGPDPLFKDDMTVNYTAPQWIDERMGAHIGAAEPMNDAVYARYRAAEKAAGRRPMSNDDFMKAVTKAKRRLARGASLSEFDSHVLEVEAAAGKRTNDLLDLSRRHGVVGAEDFNADPHYAPVIWDRSKMDAAAVIHGEAGVLETLAAAIRIDQPELDARQAVRVAKMVWTKAGLNDNQSEFRRANFLREATREELLQALREANPDLSDDEVAAILKIVRNQEPAGGEARFKRRTEMDHTYVHDFGDGRKLSVEDMLENNWEILERHYADHMIRSSAMAEVYRAASPGDTPAKSIKGLIEALKRDAEKLGYKPEDYQNDLGKLEVMLRIAAGSPLSDHKAPHVRAARTLRNMQVFRTLSGIGTGLQNASEMVGAVQQAGFGALLRQMPALGTVFKRGADAQLSNELVREIQTMTGLGTDWITRRVMPRMADDAGAITPAGRIERGAAQLARLGTAASGIAAGHTWMQRSIGELIAQRWLDTALSGKQLSARRLASLGVNEAQGKAIAGFMQKYATKEKGWAGYRLIALNLERWGADEGGIEAASILRQSISREARRLILVNSPASYSRWMTTETGKTLAQLRTFAFGSWTNKLLYGIQQRDVSNFIHIGVGTVAAGLTYMLRTYIDSIGRSDQARFLRERLSTSEIAKASFSRAAYSALIPTMVDTVVSDIGGRPQVFGQARTTGLEGGALFGNPTWDWLNRSMKAMGSVQAPFASDYDFSRRDVENLRAALWIPRFYGLNQIIQQLTKDLPARSLNDE